MKRIHFVIQINFVNKSISSGFFYNWGKKLKKKKSEETFRLFIYRTCYGNNQNFAPT